MQFIPLLVLTLASTNVDQPAKTAVTADGRNLVFTAATVTRNPAGAMTSLTTAEGVVQFPLDEIVEVTLAPAKTLKDAGIRVLLVNGDAIYGTFQEKGENSLKISSPTLGALEFNLDHVLCLHFLPQAKSLEAPPRSEEDGIALTSGDLDRGIIESITADEISINSSQFKTKRTVKTKDVVSIAFAQIGKPPTTPETPYQIVTTTDGSTISGLISAMDDKHLEIAPLLGRKHDIPLANAAGFTVKNGRVIWLSDLQPVKVDENPNYIRMEKPLPSDLEFPFQKERNVLGGPLMIGGRHYKKGLGVHSRSRLTFKLDRRFKTFSADVGIDDCAAGNADFKGDVVFELYADNNPKPIWSGGNVRGGEPPRECRVDVSEIAELMLVVGFGNEGNIRDYADWGAARLLKK